MAPNTPPPDWPIPPGPGDEEDPVEGDNAKSPRPQTTVGGGEKSGDADGGSAGKSGRDGGDGDGDGGRGGSDDTEPTGGVAAGSGSTVGGPLNMALILLGFGFLAVGTGLFVQLRMRSRRRPRRS